MNYDVSGPGGNVFAVVGNALDWARETWGPDSEQVKEIKGMTTVRCKDGVGLTYDEILDRIEKMFRGSVKFTGRCGQEEEDE